MYGVRHFLGMVTVTGMVDGREFLNQNQSDDQDRYWGGDGVSDRGGIRIEIGLGMKMGWAVGIGMGIGFEIRMMKNQKEEQYNDLHFKKLFLKLFFGAKD